MAKLPDGMVTIFEPDKISIHMHSWVLILCKNCKYYEYETDMCKWCNCVTEENGYCDKAEKKEEDIVEDKENAD